MSDAQLFDVIRGIAGRGLTQAEVDAVNAALGRVPAASGERTLRDPETFFALVRAVTGPLNAEQVATINALVAAAAAARWRTSWLAYGLATAWHEARLAPIAEWGKGKDRPYGKPGKHGQAQYGRGLVQLTWDANYERADRELGLGGALLADFDKALEPEIAVLILVRGMEEGWFTGRRLGDCLSAEIGAEPQFREARRIVNGLDRASLIAGHALRFQKAAVAGGWWS